MFAIVPALYATGGSCSDKTSVVRCGVNSKSQVLAAYDKNERSMRTIYSHMGISRADIANASFVSGKVYRNGNVVVGNKVVATGARTAGHNWGSGYGQKKIPGTSDAYTYSTGALVSDARPVLVSMVNGTFKYAVIISCGNPVTATPPPAPKPQPVYACDALQASATKIQAGKEVTFTANGTAKNGAKIVSYTYNFGDGASSTTGARTQSHTYTKAGSYTATLKVNVSVNGKTVAVTGNKCAVAITVETPPTPEVPSVDIEKTVNKVKDTEVAVNEVFEYEIVVKNTGKVTLKNAVVTDNAPSQVTLLSADQGTISGNTWTYTIPSLAAGESKSFALKAKYTAYVAGTHVNKVCVDTPTITGSPDDCDSASTHTFKKEKIQVCDLTDNTIKTIDKDEFDEKTMTTDLSKCKKETIQVCDTTDNTIKTIDKSDFDESTMTTDLSKCKKETIQVCDTTDNSIKTIDKSAYDESTMTTDLSKCETTPVTPETPAELPHTGIAESVTGFVGLGSIAGAGYAFYASRRHL